MLKFIYTKFKDFEKMIAWANLIVEQKGVVLIMAVLLVLLGVTLPVTYNVFSNKKILKVLEPTSRDVAILKEQMEHEIIGTAIAAYTKIKTVDDLKANPNNRFNIERALKYPKARKLLMLQDRERTLKFCKYFNIEVKTYVAKN